MTVDALPRRRRRVLIAGSPPAAAFGDRFEFRKPFLDVPSSTAFKACSRMQRTAFTRALSDSPSC
jgi:hypothetical protein